MTSSQIKSRLDIILVLAVIDAILLVPLVLHSLVDLDVPVFPIGLTHGLLVVVLVVLCAEGVLKRAWAWWFPFVIVVPPFSIIGEVIVRRTVTA
ncbi:MAG: hypothetical protein H0W96_13745 [Solirubrobacterales bacterium]|nr:hypothetical protein [Solirubrobacterales bacterium]